MDGEFDAIQKNYMQKKKKSKKKKKKSSTLWWNTHSSLEDKKIWWHISSIMQDYAWTKHDKEMEVKLYPHLPKKGDLGITKNYRSITPTAVDGKIYYALLINRTDLNSRKFLEKLIIDFDNLLNLWRRTCKISRGKTIVHTFFRGIWFHSLW